MKERGKIEKLSLAIKRWKKIPREDNINFVFFYLALPLIVVSFFVFLTHETRTPKEKIKDYEICMDNLTEQAIYDCSYKNSNPVDASLAKDCITQALRKQRKSFENYCQKETGL